MSDEVYFPDEVDCAKKKLAESKATDNDSLEDPPAQLQSTEGNPLVWQSDTIDTDNVDGQRIVFPDELQNIRNRASENIDIRLEEGHTEGNLDVDVTNMIVAPPNCPKGQQMGADGVCRDIF